MSTVAFALGLFAVTFLVHLVWWRIRIPRRQTATILLLFFAALPIGVVAARSIPTLAPRVPTTFWGLLLVAQFHYGAALAYACINSALQHDSPALMVVTYVALAGAKGRTRDEVRTILRDDVLIEPRIREFAAGGIIELAGLGKAGGRYRLTPRGLRFLRTMTLVRNVFRLPRGG
jgi:predicted permease